MLISPPDDRDAQQEMVPILLAPPPFLQVPNPPVEAIMLRGFKGAAPFLQPTAIQTDKQMNKNKNQQNTVKPGKEETLISSYHIIRYKCTIFNKNSKEIGQCGLSKGKVNQQKPSLTKI